MVEHNIIFKENTFGQLEKGVVLDYKDPYHIMSSFGPRMRDAVLHNPTGYRRDEVCQILALDENVVVGIINCFSGRLKIREKIVPVQNGSHLFSHEDYRKDNVGGELFLRLTNLHPTKNNFYSGISNMALPIYKALKYTIFEFPRLIFLLKSRCVVSSILHSERWWTRPIIWLADTFLWINRNLILFSIKLKFYKYKVEKINFVPREIEEIVMADHHSFMEYHDKAWFEWSLNHSFSEDERTKKRLYVVRHRGEIEAFFLIKQEFFEQASRRGIRNVYLGSVMEWGIKDGSLLKEKDIALYSLQCFDKKVDGIQYASSEKKTINQLKRRLFVQVGNANLGFRLGTIKDESIKDINNWRIRLAGGDTVLD